MSGRTIILNIVVDEGEIMKQFDGCGGRKGKTPITAPCFSGQKQKHRTYPFASLVIGRLVFLIDPTERVAEHDPKTRGIACVLVYDLTHGYIQVSQILLRKLCREHGELHFQ
jgi:hypothetical protein